MKRFSNDSNQENTLNSETALVFWFVTFGIAAIAIVLSNVLTMVGFGRMRCHARKKRNSHLFLLNLAVSDLLVGVTAVPAYVYMLGGGIWISTVPVRAVFRFFDILLGLASVFSITMVSLERFVAVKWPIEYRMLKPRHYFIAITLTWISAGTAAVLNVLRLFESVAQMLFISVAITAPLIITTASYISIWKMKRRSRSLSQQRKSFDGDAEFARTLVIVTTIFFLTWSPFLILNIVFVYCKSSSCRVLVVPFKLLHYSNSCANPVIYVFRIPTLRRAIKDVLLGIFHCFTRDKREASQGRDA